MTRLLEKMRLAPGIFSRAQADNKLSFRAISEAQAFVILLGSKLLWWGSERVWGKSSLVFSSCVWRNARDRTMGFRPDCAHGCAQARPLFRIPHV
jgi:hypothetical protein